MPAKGDVMKVKRLGPVCGAEITGVDLADLDGETWGAIRQAFVDHQVLVFPDQAVDTATQVEFGCRFGDLLVHHFSRYRTEGLPELMTIHVNEANADPLTDIWHSDETYRPAPPMATVLRSIALPDLGGDTVFASMTAAYDGLSSRMKDYIAGLTAVHGFGRFRHRFQRDPSLLPLLHEVELEIPNPSHPVVTVHPESGRKVLFVNWHFTTHVDGLPEDESRMLLDFLRNRVLQAEYQFRVRWQPDMLVVWDNRSVQHYAPKDYFPQTRKLERVTIAGQVPIAAEPGPPIERARIDIGPAAI